MLEAQTWIIEAEQKSAESKQKSAESKSAKVDDALDKAFKRLEMCKNIQDESMEKFWEERIEQLQKKLLELENEEIGLLSFD